MRVSAVSASSSSAALSALIAARAAFRNAPSFVPSAIKAFGAMSLLRIALTSLLTVSNVLLFIEPKRLMMVPMMVFIMSSLNANF